MSLGWVPPLSSKVCKVFHSDTLGPDFGLGLGWSILLVRFPGVGLCQVQGSSERKDGRVFEEIIFLLTFVSTVP